MHKNLYNTQQERAPLTSVIVCWLQYNNSIFDLKDKHKVIISTISPLRIKKRWKQRCFEKLMHGLSEKLTKMKMQLQSDSNPRNPNRLHLSLAHCTAKYKSDMPVRYESARPMRSSRSIPHSQKQRKQFICQTQMKVNSLNRQTSGAFYTLILSMWSCVEKYKCFTNCRSSVFVDGAWGVFMAPQAQARCIQRTQYDWQVLRRDFTIWKGETEKASQGEEMRTVALRGDTTSE